MSELIPSTEKNLIKGKILDRPNRFILEVELDSEKERVYLQNPGALSTVLSQGREILCEPASKPERKTDYNAFAVKVSDIYVTVKSTFANSLFLEAFKNKMLEGLEEYSLVKKEPQLPDHGRADFLLKENGSQIFVEVKSCTHVEDGIAKFPDRPTKRGRRHVKTLTRLSKSGEKNYLFFVIQRPDAEEFRPFKEVDPKFTDLLKESQKKGVEIRAISTKFSPPHIYLENGSIPVEL